MRTEELQALTERLLQSYDVHPTRPDQGEALPPMESIINLIEEVRRLLFPGFYSKVPLDIGSRNYRVGHWIAQLHQTLSRVLALALSRGQAARIHPLITKVETTEAGESSNATEPEAAKHEVTDLCAVAEALSSRLLAQLPALRSTLITDARAALEGDPAAASLEEVILTYPGFEAIMTHRFAHLLYLERVPYLPRALAEYSHTRTGIDLHPGAKIGRSFFIDHGTGVVIGETAEIGDRVKIYQGVTLGALSVKRSLCGSKRHPTIEDDVIIYAGATVLGGDTRIGAGSIIGGSVWVVDTIPPKSVVIGTPPSFKMQESSR